MKTLVFHVHMSQHHHHHDHHRWPAGGRRSASIELASSIGTVIRKSCLGAYPNPCLELGFMIKARTTASLTLPEKQGTLQLWCIRSISRLFHLTCLGAEKYFARWHLMFLLHYHLYAIVRPFKRGHFSRSMSSHSNDLWQCSIQHWVAFTFNIV